MLSQVHSFEYNAAHLTEPSIKVDVMLILFCLAGLLLFVSGLIVGKTMTSMTLSSETVNAEPALRHISIAQNTHGRYGVPRWR
jgi:hypothetical protein